MWVLIIISSIIVIYYFFIKPYKYWTERGVKQGTPIPVLGDFWKAFFRLQNITEVLQEVYNKVGQNRYYGTYFFFKPALLIKDPELIKAITVKDFDHFMDHRPFIEESIDPVWGKNLLSLKGEKWKIMRSNVSPAFTGNKMRLMYGLMAESSEQFVNFFMKNKEKVICLEMKSVFTKFCNDLIASTAFGIKVDSFENPDNDFYKMGQKITDISGLKFLGHAICPKLMRLLDIKLFDEEASIFLQKIITDNIDYRRKNSVSRPDLINLLLDAQKKANLEEEKAEITDLDIVSQVVTFFFGGFDAVSTLMSMVAYELMANPDVQEKLIEEIDKICENTKPITYEDISEMKYLDMVISETLRKWPSNIATDRVCTKPYTIQPEKPGERPLTLHKGDMVQLISWTIQRDPEFYTDPNRFDPERFNEGNKSKINPYTYLPFGIGPRVCIGSRLTILETKALFGHLLRNFELIPIDKTVIPLKLDPKAANFRVEGGIWLGFKRRIIDL